MWYPNLEFISEWFLRHGGVALAVVATAGIALVLGCALGCACSPRKEKDRLFHREVF